MQMTYKIAMAAGQDAGNRSMRVAGRRCGSADDWNVAQVTVAKLMGL